MAFLDAISKPFRGVGRLLRGKFREGFSDLGETAKLASLPVSFVNPLAGGALRALGEVGDAADDPGGVSGLKLGKQVIAPAALTAGAGFAARGVGSLLRGGQTAASAAPEAASLGAEGASGGMGLINVPEAVSQAAPQAGRFAGVGRALRGAGSFVKENPEVLPLALQTYGAYRNDEFERDMLQEDRDARRRAAEARAQALMSFGRGY